MPTGKGAIRTALEDFLETFGFGRIVNDAIKFVDESKELEFIGLLGDILDLYIGVADGIPQLKKILIDVKNAKHQAGASVLGGLASGLGQGMVSSISSPVMNILNQGMNKKFKANILDPAAYIRARQLQEIDGTAFVDRMERHGLSEYEAGLLASIGAKRLDAADLIQVSRRFPDKTPNLDLMILKTGWNPLHSELLKLLTFNYPSPQDIIRFAVRETFDEQQVKSLDLDAHFPENARIEAEKGGLAPDWFKHYWRAHWELPPATMGFEFYHRFFKESDPNHFSREDLSGLLRALDIAPTWHNKMLELSTNLLTRVDLRRVWKAGAPGIDDQFVYDEYRRSGYDDMRAKAILWWLKWENNKEDLDLTKEEVHKAYVQGIYKYKEASEALKAAEPNEGDRRFLLTLWDAEIKRNENNAQIDLIKSEYVDGQYDEVEMIRRLAALGLSTTQQSTLTIQFNIARRKAIKHLTRPEIELLYENNQIQLAELESKLDALGYIQPELKQMIFIITLNVSKRKEKELEDTQKEQERLATATASTAFQVETAAVNTQIAQLNAQIAELKLAAVQSDDAELTGETETMILEIKRDIAYLNVSKAQIALKHREEIRSIVG